MKKCIVFLLALLCLLSLAACHKNDNTDDTTENTDDLIQPGTIDGTFGYAPDGRPAIYLSEETRANGYSDVFMIIYPNPFVENPPTLDGLKEGDRIRITCLTIADLDPRVVDADKIEVLIDQ